jgi:hypothetical protein
LPVHAAAIDRLVRSLVGDLVAPNELPRQRTQPRALAEQPLEVLLPTVRAFVHAMSGRRDGGHRFMIRATSAQ